MSSKNGCFFNEIFSDPGEVRKTPFSTNNYPTRIVKSRLSILYSFKVSLNFLFTKLNVKKFIKKNQQRFTILFFDTFFSLWSFRVISNMLSFMDFSLTFSSPLSCQFFHPILDASFPSILPPSLLFICIDFF